MLKEFVKVATMADFPEDGMISVSVNGGDILLVRIGEEFYAIAGWCTHAAGRLHDGYLHPDTCEIECPKHESYFDLRTGEATNTPAEEPVATYAVHLEGDHILVGPKSSDA